MCAGRLARLQQTHLNVPVHVVIYLMRQLHLQSDSRKRHAQVSVHGLALGLTSTLLSHCAVPARCDAAPGITG